ncbi:MAG: hypothetical protein Q9195_008885 [Heterodermia aff. obscurata]
MASGLLKYVGRPSEKSSWKESDEATNERIKARMEQMGMVESELQRAPKTSIRGTSNKMSSNRHVVADQARVTPKSLKLNRSTSLVPQVLDSRSKISSGQISPTQRGNRLPRVQNDSNYSDSEGGMFDTDAENLESTTYISDVGEGSVCQTHDNDDPAAASGISFNDGSEYEERVPVIRNDNSRHAHSKDDSKIGSIDMAMSSSDGHGSPDRDSNPDGSQYGHEAANAILQEPPDTEYSQIANTPISRQRVIEAVLESPSIQQSLAYRTVAGLPKQPPTRMHSKIGIANPAVTISGQEIQHGGLQYTESMPKPVSTSGVMTKVPTRPESMEIVAQPAFADDSFGPTIERQRQQVQQSLLLQSVHRTQRGSTDDISADRAVSQFHSQREMKTSHPVPSSQRMLRGESQPTMPAGATSEEQHVLLTSAQTIPQELSKASWEQPSPVSHDKPSDTRIDGSAQLLEHFMAPNIIAQFHAQDTAPQYPGTKRSEDPQPSTFPPVNDTAGANGKKVESRKRDLELDYTPAELSGMTYKLLNSESFDHIPNVTSASLQHEFPEHKLKEKIQIAYNIKGNDERHSQRQALFTNLTLEQYEEAGDLLLQKFSEVVGRYKEARRSKRIAAKELEKEVTQREELVRSKTTAVDGDLTGLRQAGQKVVQGKYA